MTRAPGLANTYIIRTPFIFWCILMKRIFLTLCLSLAATMAQATTISIDFSGNPTHNPGIPGHGPFSGNVSFDSVGSTSIGSGFHSSGFSRVNMSVNGINAISAGAPTVNSVTQVDLTGGVDALLTTYSGSYFAGECRRYRNRERKAGRAVPFSRQSSLMTWMRSLVPHRVYRCMISPMLAIFG